MKRYTEIEVKEKLKKYVRANFIQDKEAATFYGVTPVHISNCMNVKKVGYMPTDKMLQSIGLEKTCIITKIKG